MAVDRFFRVFDSDAFVHLMKEYWEDMDYAFIVGESEGMGGIYIHRLWAKGLFSERAINMLDLTRNKFFAKLNFDLSKETPSPARWVNDYVFRASFKNFPLIAMLKELDVSEEWGEGRTQNKFRMEACVFPCYGFWASKEDDEIISDPFPAQKVLCLSYGYPEAHMLWDLVERAIEARELALARQEDADD